MNGSIKALLAIFVLAATSFAMNGDEYAAEFPGDDFLESQPPDYMDAPPVEDAPLVEGAFFTDQRPPEFGTLVDQGPVSEDLSGQYDSGTVAESGLWISDAAGGERLTTLNVPAKSYANQEIIPNYEGDLLVYYRHPSGEVKTYNYGYVYPYHRYWLWFYDVIPGTYEVWYTVGGRYESNHIWYYLWDDWPWWYGGYTYYTYWYNPVVYVPHSYPHHYRPVRFHTDTYPWPTTYYKGVYSSFSSSVSISMY